MALRAARTALEAGRPVLVQVPRRGLRARAGLRPLPHHRPLQALHRPAVAARPGHRGRRCAAGAAARNRRCAARDAGPTRCAPWSSAPAAPPRNSAGRFPAPPSITSGGDAMVSAVPGDPALVVATPGRRARAPTGGYGAALLLDGWALLGRQDLRAAEDTLRRWMAAAALVRPPRRRRRGRRGRRVGDPDRAGADPLGSGRARRGRTRRSRRRWACRPLCTWPRSTAPRRPWTHCSTPAELPETARAARARRPAARCPQAARCRGRQPGQPDAGAGAPRRRAGAGSGAAAGHRRAQRPARSSSRFACKSTRCT